jgi:hypothetical protein
VGVAAVAYYRVVDAVKSVIAIEDVRAAIDQIAQTTLRKVVVGRAPGPSRSRRPRAGHAELDAFPSIPCVASGPVDNFRVSGTGT